MLGSDGLASVTDHAAGFNVERHLSDGHIGLVAKAVHEFQESFDIEEIAGQPERYPNGPGAFASGAIQSDAE